MLTFEDDEEIHDEDDDIGYDLKRSKYVDDIKSQALECIDHFFCDKVYWAGGAIPKSKLYKEKYVEVVMEISFMDAFALAYFCLKNNPPDTVNVTEKRWDYKLCYDCLIQCEKRYIPKCHMGGILLMYLSLCHGVDFIPTLNKLGEIKKMLAKKEKEADLKMLVKEQKNGS